MKSQKKIIWIGILGATLLGFGTVRSQPIYVLTLDTSRTGTNWNFLSSPQFQPIKNTLLDSARFGPAGVIRRAVAFLPEVREITEAALSGADIVLWCAALTIATNQEVALLKKFVAEGGGLFAFGNEITNFNGLVGASGGGRTPLTGATVNNGASPVVKGPFGSVALGTWFQTGFQGYIGTVDTNSILAIQNPGGIFAASFTVGSGRAVLIGDEEVFNSVTIPYVGVAYLTATTRIIFLNSFAHVIPPPGWQPPRLTIFKTNVSDVAICWKSFTNRVYQVQRMSDLTTNAWTEFGSPTNGNGTTNFTFDSTNGFPRGFYRVEILP